MAGSRDGASAAFTQFYLQKATAEFAEDLDKVRTADDFKGDALPMLIKALQQGTALFPPADQRRILDAGTELPGSEANEDASSSTSSSGDSSSSSGDSSSSSGGSSSSDDEEK